MDHYVRRETALSLAIQTCTATNAGPGADHEKVLKAARAYDTFLMGEETPAPPLASTTTPRR